MPQTATPSCPPDATAVNSKWRRLYTVARCWPDTFSQADRFCGMAEADCRASLPCTLARVARQSAYAQATRQLRRPRALSDSQAHSAIQTDGANESNQPQAVGHVQPGRLIAPTRLLQLQVDIVSHPKMTVPINQFQPQAVGAHPARHIQTDRLLALMRNARPADPCCLHVCTAAYSPREHMQPDTHSQYRLIAHRPSRPAWRATPHATVHVTRASASKGCDYAKPKCTNSHTHPASTD
jgi:hypothetical protein